MVEEFHDDEFVRRAFSAWSSPQFPMALADCGFLRWGHRVADPRRLGGCPRLFEVSREVPACDTFGHGNPGESGEGWK